MKQLLLLTICLFNFYFTQAQSNLSTPEKKLKSFIVSIKTLDNVMIKGKLHAINDSQLVLAKSSINFSDPLQANGLQYISADDINSFSLRRKNSVLKGALLGFGAGALIGISSGLISGDDPVYRGPVNDPLSAIFVGIGNALAMTAGEKAASGGVILGAGGAIIGTVIGAVAKKKFSINGNKEKFRSLQSEITMKLER